ncbi:GFA family protein [Sphingomonas sp. So64.6b]|uniref:GFA family protein n=1 Tax=Sphingomonas sp. So64.6b TaxID=2997354 RepID=UPI0016034642|nr:GFA family protein [Sphingomonas sp. So64.6b]QNA83570.1 GFA family protein [Sphingomonas sp. So64.6b]
MPSGKCHCGAISYVASGDPVYHALCHCDDCRRSAGAPMVGWMAYKAEQVEILGDPVTYESSENGRRQFCGTCGTGLFYTNAVVLPGIIDLQSATLDDAGDHAPAIHVQAAEKLGWIDRIKDLPAFERYPGP